MFIMVWHNQTICGYLSADRRQRAATNVDGVKLKVEGKAIFCDDTSSI